MSSRSVARSRALPLATLLVFTVVAAAPLWGSGLLNTRGGGDSPFNLLRTHQLAANLRAGVFPARWMPDAAYGFGYPFFSYYAALPYYLSAGLTVLGLDILSAIKLTQTVAMAAAALSMYGWTQRALRSRAGGWLAAIAYTCAPYHLVNLYVRGDSLSEFTAFCFYPLVLWGLDRLAERPTLRRTIPPALAYACLIATHNLSALLFSPFALLYLVMLTWRSERRRRRVLAFGILALACGIALSTWYWLPALAEIDSAQLSAQTSGFFFYGNHFRGANLVQPGLVFDYIIAPERASPFAMGLVQAALALSGAVIVCVRCLRPQRSTGERRRTTGLGVFVLAGLILSTWLITPLSRPVWDHLPPLAMAQFPWRLLSIQALFTALLAGVLVVPPGHPKQSAGTSAARKRLVRYGAAGALATCIVVTTLAGLHPTYLPIAAKDVTTERLQLYELFTENIGTTIRAEYLPRWVVPRPFTGPTLFDPIAPPRAISLNGELVEATRHTRQPTRRVWTVETGSGGAAVAFPLYYWPGWRGTVDETAATARPAPGSGYLTLDVPAGRHTVVLQLGRTPLRALAEGLSAITGLAVLVVTIVGRRSGRAALFAIRPTDRGHGLAGILHATASPRLLCYASYLIGLVLLLAFAPRISANGSTDLSMDFDCLPYLHHNPDGISLDGWRLLGYTYSADRLAPGQTLQVTLDREGWKSAEATLELVTPAAIRQDDLPAMATASVRIENGTGHSTLTLTIPQDVGPGLHLLRLRNGKQTEYLRPLWLEAEQPPAGQATIGTFAQGTLRLHALQVTQRTPDQLDVVAGWTATATTAANYGVSLRLSDPAGNEWATPGGQPLDTQPGYGLLPSSLWPAGRLIHDRYTLSTPAGLPPGDAYTLSLILYDVATGERVGEHSVPVSLEQATLRPDAPTGARFDDALSLSGLDVPEQVGQGETLPLTAYWLAREAPSTDYRVRWQLDGPVQTITISTTTPLAPGSLPSTWPAGAWITGRVSVPIPSTAAAGAYTLSLTLLDPVTEAPVGSHVAEQQVQVLGRERTWELPTMQQEVGTRFGGMIELAGYDLQQEGSELHLTLHWRSLAVAERHYMFFVHVAEPAGGRPVTQVDTMPLGFTYPTGMWAPGEVVSDEVSLSLAGIPPGQYDLVVGWYDPETRDRLPAVDGAGSLLPDGRAILPDGVTAP